jgi:PhnB protein
MISVNPYLNFKGNTEEAMTFYKSVFGGEFSLLQRFTEIPGHEKMPENEWEKVMHISLPLGEDGVLMATDVLDSMEQEVVMGNNYYICIQTESEEETNRLFKSLSEGGKIEMLPNKTFWNDYFGICTDKFGVQWMLNYSGKTAAENESKLKTTNKTITKKRK